MKVGLVHNSDAGDALTVEQMAEALERHGHHLARSVTPEDGIDALRIESLDAVIAAGGDGTIASVAVSLAGTGVPLGILPMGTANNIALSLDLPADLDGVIDSWQQARTRLLDVGVASGPWGERRFVESVGGGLVTHGMVVMDRQTGPRPDADRQLARALRAHLDVLALADPVPWRLILDEQPIEGAFLLVEVLNMRAIGPNLVFTGAASPWDGKFTIVAATADDRDEVAAYLRGRAEGKDPPITLQTWHAASVTIEEGDRLHVDDEVVGDAGAGRSTIRMQPAAVAVLVPHVGPHLRDRT